MLCWDSSSVSFMAIDLFMPFFLMRSIFIDLYFLKNLFILSHFQFFFAQKSIYQRVSYGILNLFYFSSYLPLVIVNFPQNNHFYVLVCLFLLTFSQIFTLSFIISFMFLFSNLLNFISLCFILVIFLYFILTFRVWNLFNVFFVFHFH